MQDRRGRTLCITNTTDGCDRDLNALDGDTSFEETCYNGTVEEVQAYMSETADALVLTDSKGRIVDVNTPWEYLCGYTSQSVKGKTSSILHGPLTETAVSRDLHSFIVNGFAVRRSITNYKQSGTKFTNNVTILPLRRVQHNGPAFVAKLCEVI